MHNGTTQQDNIMFTGIVAAVSRVERVEALGDGPATGLRLRVHADGLDMSDVGIGDSIAIQGACMTAVAIDGPGRPAKSVLSRSAAWIACSRAA